MPKVSSRKMRDAVSYNSVVSCCAKGAQWHLAAALFSEMEVQQIKKDAISFSSVISAAERGQHWAVALAVLQQMFHAKVAEDVIVHNAAISAWLGDSWNAVACAESSS